MTTTTIPTPTRISTISYLIADLTTALFGPDHPGADTDWLQQLRGTGPAIPGPDDTPTTVIPAVRRPIAAITARPHIEQVCPLDACPLDLGPLADAGTPIHDELADVIWNRRTDVIWNRNSRAEVAA